MVGSSPSAVRLGGSITAAASPRDGMPLGSGMFDVRNSKTSFGENTTAAGLVSSALAAPAKSPSDAGARMAG